MSTAPQEGQANIAWPAILTVHCEHVAKEKAFNWYHILLNHSEAFVTWMRAVHQRRWLISSGTVPTPGGVKAFWRFHPVPFDLVSQSAWEGVYVELLTDLSSGVAFIEHAPGVEDVITKHFFGSDFNDLRADTFMEACMLASANLLSVRYDLQLLRSRKNARIR